ncbi:MAG: phenylalanine--tRNA ligase subunit beta [Phycisphaerales bacterium]|nr:phenylalanine--tRNA ligase subunit beta [Phycisphaerales bacterium]
MKIALDWIAEYLNPTPAAELAADALMNAGLPVESIVDAIGGGGAKAATKVLDIEVTSNRTDCFCHVGLARELAALSGGGGVFAMPRIEIAESTTPASSLTSVTVDDPENCPYYSARVIRNVKVGASPEWLRRRLESIGLRSINNVVDITNYVLMELGQPLHVFDYDQLAGRRIVVRKARAGEKMLAIDAKEYALDASMLVIADANKAVAIAGVMGGKPTEVTEKTTTILLESARFDPLSIRTTSRALGLKSDASYRYERGIDPTMAETASRRAAQLIQQIAGGDLAHGVVAVGNAAARNIQLAMRFDRYRKIIGVPVTPDRAIAILTALGFTPRIDKQIGGGVEGSEKLLAHVPSHRLDVEREIDLIEEIARVVGYSHVPTLDRVSHPVSSEPPEEKAARTILQTMTQAGFSEAVTVTFIPESDGKPFLTDAGSSLIHLQHAGWKSDVIRPSILPSLLAVRQTNQNLGGGGTQDARVFEKAEVALQPADKKSPPLRRRMLAAVASDLASLTGLLPLLADRLNVNAKIGIQPKDFPIFVRGASAEVLLSANVGGGGDQGSVIGRVGLFTSELQKKYDLRNQVAGIELDWDALIRIFVPVRRAVAVPRFPGIKRDLSVVIDEAVRWADVHAALMEVKLASLASVDFVTTFRSKEIGTGKKSLTLTLDFRDPARTLKSEEVDAQVQTAIQTLANKFHAVLRA